LPDGLQDGIIPSSLTSFVQLLSRHLPEPTLQTPPPRRRCQSRVAPVSAPHRSARLAKKAINRPPAVVVAQNLLMHKLGLSAGKEASTEDFDRYIKMFANDLSEEQAKMIGDLFMNYVPPPDSIEDELQ
jgi:hypothetical protein